MEWKILLCLANIFVKVSQLGIFGTNLNDVKGEPPEYNYSIWKLIKIGCLGN